MMLQMQFIRRRRVSSLSGFVSVTAITFAFALAGCSSMLTTVKMAPKTLANKLGFTGCEVSVPLSQSEVIEDAKRIGNPHPEEYPQWIAITKNLRPGDQLRLVTCLQSNKDNKFAGQYFYALIRDNEDILRFYPMIFD
ncbi:MAG TPA: hypothetical protein VFL78_00490 [Rhodanobacteraceae bacterium]|nr:hypothetical protein [Rhodanobacteraceae bacterium]